MLDLGASDLQREKIGKPIHSEYPNWVITDMRFPNELEAIKNRDGISIRVNRGPQNSKGHESETALDSSIFDYTIDNNSTIEDLIAQVKTILEKENII